jgi:hypothetical protein
MVNTFLFGIFRQFDAEMRRIMAEPALRDFRHRVLDELAARSAFEVVLTVGTAAREAIALWPRAAELPVFHLTHPAAGDQFIVDNWNTHLPAVIDKLTPDEGISPDPTPYEAPLGASIRVPIPRADLPFGVPEWFGTASTSSKRDGDDTIVWRSP